MTWQAAAQRLWSRVERLIPPVPASAGLRGRPYLPDEAVFYRLVLFLRAGCSWEVFDLLLALGGGVSGRTVRRRVATRWERSWANYRSWVCLALSLIYVRGD
jgi:hypothetical protein